MASTPSISSVEAVLRHSALSSDKDQQLLVQSIVTAMRQPAHMAALGEKGMFARLLHPSTFRSIVYDSLEASRARQFPSSFQHFVVDPRFVPMLPALLSDAVRRAKQVITAVQRRGAAEGEAMPASVRASLWPGMLREGFAHSIRTQFAQLAAADAAAKVVVERHAAPVDKASASAASVLLSLDEAAGLRRLCEGQVQRPAASAGEAAAPNAVTVVPSSGVLGEEAAASLQGSALALWELRGRSALESMGGRALALQHLTASTTPSDQSRAETLRGLLKHEDERLDAASPAFWSERAEPTAPRRESQRGEEATSGLGPEGLAWWGCFDPDGSGLGLRALAAPSVVPVLAGDSAGGVESAAAAALRVARAAAVAPATSGFLAPMLALPSALNTAALGGEAPFASFDRSEIALVLLRQSNTPAGTGAAATALALPKSIQTAAGAGLVSRIVWLCLPVWGDRADPGAVTMQAAGPSGAVDAQVRGKGGWAALSVPGGVAGSGVRISTTGGGPCLAVVAVLWCSTGLTPPEKATAAGADAGSDATATEAGQA